MDITKKILNFKNFLNNSWSSLYFVDLAKKGNYKEEERLDIWLEVNWELLVEEDICTREETLRHYGNGADFNIKNSKVLNQSTLYTHKVQCNSNNISVMDYFTKTFLKVDKLDFIKFVTTHDKNHYDMGTPFDFVLLEDKLYNEYMIPYTDISFFLVKIIDNE